MKTPLDLRTHGTGMPAFMALQTPLWDAALGDLFTPHVMVWSPEIRLFDLRSCGVFWQAQADQRGLPVIELFQAILEAHFRMPSRMHVASAEFRAATASHPWQAVLLVGLMAHRGMKGCLDRSGPFGTRWASCMPWSVWFDACAQLQPHVMKAKGRKARGGTPGGTLGMEFRRDLEQMRRSVERLGVRELRGLNVSAAAIKRRFGPVLARVWRWTHASDALCHASGYGDFPWSPWTARLVPRVARHLDHPRWRWEQLEPLLIHDLDALCRHEAWSFGEHVTELSWQVVLEDLEELSVDVGFRHPHALHGEMGQHQTAVQRIKTRYFDEIAQWAQERSDDETMIREWPVISWRLAATGRFTYPERNLELFEEFRAHRVHRDEIRNLENQLSIPLLRYIARRDFLPEDAFTVREASTVREAPDPDADEQLQWRQAVMRRPLFYYREPQPISTILEPARTDRADSEACDESGPQHEGAPLPDALRRYFLERVQAKWWRQPAGETAVLSRDYFRLCDAHQREHWVYRDQANRWYVHGIYS